jgi:hypothetical protein
MRRLEQAADTIARDRRRIETARAGYRSRSIVEVVDPHAELREPTR